MARNSKTPRVSNRTPDAAKTAAGSRALTIGRKGITTSNEFAAFMRGLMTDVVEGKVTPQIVNAACNAGGKVLKVVELQAKYSGAYRKLQSTKPALQLT